MVKRKGIPLKIWLSQEDYQLAKVLAEKEGFNTVSDFLAEIISRSLREAGVSNKDLEGEFKRLERLITDLLNPYTAKIDEIYRRLGEIIEMIESMTQMKVQVSKEEEEAVVQQKQKRAERPRRASAIERLRSEGVVFQEDMGWLKAPEKFFQKLEREGAVVIDTNGEKVAVDRDLWNRFREVITQVMVKDPNEAASLIAAAVGRPIVAKLFKKLVSSGLVYYDEEYGNWKISEALSKNE